MHPTITFAILIFITHLFKCKGVNILILEGVPSPSHHLWLSKLNIELAAKGHNVTSLSADFVENSIPNLHYLHLNKVYEELYGADTDEYDMFTMGEESAWTTIKMIMEYPVLICEAAIRSEGWKQLEEYPDDFKFDLVLHDHLSSFCLIAFLKKFNYPPMIAITALNDVTLATAMVGGVLAPSISTHYVYQHLKIGFFDRLENYVMQMVDHYGRKWYLHRMLDKVIREQSTISDVPPVDELMRLTKLVIINYDPAIDSPEQFSPNIIPVGGMQIRPAKQLPEDLLAIADKATNGLVLFSLGTNIQSEAFGDERISHIFEAFRRFPEYTFLCKLELEKTPVPVPKNVIMRKWIPQNDVLGHNNTKLFITHSGLMSTQESIWHGVPILGMPLFADQFLNIEKATKKGIGRRLFWNDMSADTLYNEIRQIMTEPSYQENIKIISNVFRDQKETPLERAVWWVEWLIRNPNANHMRSIADFNFIQLQSIDVLGFIFVVICLALWFAKLFAFGFLRLFSNGNVMKTKKE